MIQSDTIQPTSFHAVQLWPDEQLADSHHATNSYCRPLARVIYQTLYEQSCSAVELRSHPNHTQQVYLLGADPPTETRSTNPDSPVPSYLRTLGETARRELPQTVGVGLAAVDMRPVGTTPTPTHRLVTTKTDLSAWQDGYIKRGSSPLDAFLATLTTDRRPHILQVVAQKTTADDLVVSIRWADLSPTARCHTRDKDVAYQTTNNVPSLTDHFDSTSITTNRALPSQHGWQQRIETRLPGDDRPVRECSTQHTDDTALAAILGRTPLEYALAVGDSVPYTELHNSYRDLGVEPWPTIDSEQLAAYCGLVDVTYDNSPWETTPYRQPPAVQTQTVLRDRPTPPPTTTTKQPPAASRIETLCDEVETPHPQLLQTAARWLLEQGDRLSATTVGPKELVFERTLPDGTTEYVLIGDPTLAPETVVYTAGCVDRSQQIDGLTILVETSSTARRIAGILLEPFEYRTTNDWVRLYCHPLPLTDGTRTAVYPTTDSTEQWYLTPTGTVHCLYEDSIVGTIDPSQPPTAILDQVPWVRLDEDTPTVVTASGIPIDDSAVPYNSETDWSPMSPPIRPTRVASGLTPATVLANDHGQFREIRPQTTWDQTSQLNRQHAAAVFFDTYTVSTPGTCLPVDEVLPVFVSWLRNQTDEQIPSYLRWCLSHGYASVYDCSHDAVESCFPDCRWLYPPHN